MTILTIFEDKIAIIFIHQLKIKGVIVILAISNNIPLLYKNYNFGGKCGQRFKSYQLYFSAIIRTGLHIDANSKIVNLFLRTNLLTLLFRFTVYPGSEFVVANT